MVKDTVGVRFGWCLDALVNRLVGDRLGLAAFYWTSAENGSDHLATGHSYRAYGGYDDEVG